MTEELFYPWIAPDACTELEDNLLQSHHIAFEWGSGKSTIWLARRVKSVISVENNTEWFEKVNEWLKEYRIYNVVISEASLDGTIYEDRILYCHDNYFDIIFIDGRHRVACVKNAIPKLKPGGMLVVDDSEREKYKPGFDLLKDWQCKTWFFREGNTTIFWKPNNE